MAGRRRGSCRPPGRRRTAAARRASAAARRRRARLAGPLDRARARRRLAPRARHRRLRSRGSAAGSRFSRSCARRRCRRSRRAPAETRTRRPDPPRPPGHVGHGATTAAGTASRRGRAGHRGAKHRDLRAAKQRRTLPRGRASSAAHASTRLDRDVLLAADDRRGDHRDAARARAGVCTAPGRSAAARGTVASPPRKPLSAASSAIGSSAVPLEHRDDRRLARPGRQRAERRGELRAHGPVRVVQPLQRPPPESDGSASPSHRSAMRTADSAHVARRIVERPDHRRRLDARRSRRASTARAAASASPARSRPASRAPATTDAGSPRSTSSRCAVSRHQPFGMRERLHELRRRRASTAPGCAIAPRRLVHDAIDPPVARSAAPACARRSDRAGTR